MLLTDETRMKKYLWIPMLAVIPLSVLIALGYGPHWKPFLSRDASMVLLVLVTIGLTWSTFAKRR
jgi:hypothetical protein